VSLGEVRIFLNLSHPLFVKLDKIFLMIENFFQEFLATSSSPRFLAVSHLLLESVNCSCFFLAGCEDSGALVKVSVNKLVLVEIVSFSFRNQLLKHTFVFVIVFENLLTSRLLQGHKFDQFLEKLSLIAHFDGGERVVYDFFKVSG